MRISVLPVLMKKFRLGLDMGMEGGRIVSTGLGRKFAGYRKYNDDAREICRRIVERCYDSQRGYFRTSFTTYTDFWARDFGRCVPSLLKLGYRKEVLSSYRYALKVYKRKRKFALVITPRGNLFDFPYYAPDGFAFFLRGLVCLNAPDLVERYRTFLDKEMLRFFHKVVDRKTGLVRADRHYSEAQDYTKRTSSCYSNVMCHVTKQAAFDLHLVNPLESYDYKTLIHKQFWNGDHYWDDVFRLQHVSGDACITPFLCDVVDKPHERFAKVLMRMDEEGLTKPYVARYGNTIKKNRPMIRIERFNRWQRDTVWTCLGLQLLEVLERFDKQRYLLELCKLETLVESFRCFPEVVCPDGETLWRGPFYMSEDSMLWAADLLRMLLDRDSLSKN